MPKLTRGYFISIEGADCSGKSTTVKTLTEKLTQAGYEVVSVADLDTTGLGQSVRKLYLDHGADFEPLTEALLIMAARVENITKHIVPALRAGKIVICDRFTDSTFAYQGMAKGVGENTIGLLETLCQSSLRPDLTVLMVTDVDTIMDRLAVKKNKDKHELLPQEFHEKIIHGFNHRLMHNRARFFPVSGNNMEATNETLTQLASDIIEVNRPYIKS